MRSREGMLPLVVRAMTVESASIVSIRLEHAQQTELPPWEPGAHIDLQLLTRHERQYSLCGEPADRRSYRIAVLREEFSRGASLYIHRFLRVGARVYARPPRNLFPLAAAPSYLLIAGGIGITAILPMARELAARGAEWRALHLVRHRKDAGFADEFAELGERATVHVSSEGGRVDSAALFSGLAPGTAVYACGPQSLMADLERNAPRLPHESVLHAERFQPVRRAWLPDEPFSVVCARSGKDVTVPAGSTMLSALDKAGIELPASCFRGVCGSCAVPLLAGTAEHRDSLGTDDATGVVYPCVSRARSTTLTLDV